jgi:hypothetical protein
MIDASALLTEFLKERNWVVMSEVFDNDTQTGTIMVAYFNRRLPITIKDGVKVIRVGFPLDKPIDLHDPNSLQEILDQLNKAVPKWNGGYDEFDEEI